MTKEEIIGGLKSALSRGESLNRAMMTFFNAGYKKEDIESAAGALHMHGFEQSTNISSQKTKSTYGLPKPKKEVQKIIPSKPAQKVSNYEQPQGKFGLGIVIVLAFILIALLGVLVGVIFFKENLVEFFNNFF